MDLNNLNNYQSRSTTEIVLVLDESGSMESYRDEAINGLNNFIQRQRQALGEASITVVTFSYPSSIRLVVDAEPITTVCPFSRANYRPDGNTALFDAIAKSIIATNTRLASLPATEQPSKVIFCIFTDGQENSSRDFEQEDVKAMITEQEDKYHWDFLYLGANQDAYKVGNRFGIKPGKALTYSQTQDGIAAVFNATGESVARYRSSGRPTGDQFFTEEDHRKQESLGAVSSPRGS